MNAMKATITRRFGAPEQWDKTELNPNAWLCKPLHRAAKFLPQIRLTHFYRVQWVTWHSLKQPRRNLKTAGLFAAQRNSVYALGNEQRHAMAAQRASTKHGQPQSAPIKIPPPA